MYRRQMDVGRSCECRRSIEVPFGVFIGPYVENDEISFSDLYLETGYRGTRTPFELKIIRLIDGRLAYYYNAPEYKIPKAVKDGLSWMKKFDEESKREIKVVFTPHGDERKMLDIILLVSPDKNPEQYAWAAWGDYGSKKRYIEEFNKLQMHFYNESKKFGSNRKTPDLLREEDYDI